MTGDLTSSILLNPMMLWADLGLRALDMTLTSTQNLSEDADRLARSGASAEPAADSASGVASAATSPLAMASQWQRSTFDLMTDGWLQWMSALGAMASMASGGAWSSLGRLAPAVDAMRSGVRATPGAEQPAMPERTSKGSKEQRHSRREDEREALEHAFAATKPARRRAAPRPKAKPRSRA